MTARLSLALIALVWAALYLPSLGDPELRGEEIRRILPAQGMLETGDWVVPRIAGEVYSNKPPLINWAIATLFAVTGSHSELSARLVSALSLLALALAAFALLRKGRDDRHALFVSLALLTTLTLIAKGRLIEIEALFTALFGIACFLWIRLWSDARSPWLYWTLPYLLLGAGCLAKGPVHLVFWFPFVAGALLHFRQGRLLLHPAHFLGILLMGLVVLPWVAPYLKAVGLGDDSLGNWVEEVAIRGDVSQIEWDRVFTNPFKIPGGFLPWTVPLLYALWHLRKDRFSLRRGGREDAILAGALASLAIGYLVVCLLPGGVPRYLMPVYPLAALATVALYFRLPAPDQDRYERFGQKANLVLVPTLLIAPLAIALTVRSDGGTVPTTALVFGTAALVVVAAFVLGPWRQRPVFLTTSLVVAAGGIGLLPAMQPFQGEHEQFRRAARDLAALVPDDSRIVVYADAEFRNRLTKHLRLLYYVREPIDGIGESGRVPNDAALLVGRPEAESAMREKLAGRVIESQSIVEIHHRPLLVFRLRPST